MIDGYVHAFAFVYTFVFAYIAVFLLHELGHCLEAHRQGATDIDIRIWFWHGIIPSMMATCSGLKNKDYFDIAGGMFAGITALILGILGWITGASWIEIPFVTLGVMNLVYSIYEYKYLSRWSRDKYMVFHYLLYVCVIVGMLFLYYLRSIL